MSSASTTPQIVGTLTGRLLRWLRPVWTDRRLRYGATGAVVVLVAVAVTVGVSVSHGQEATGVPSAGHARSPGQAGLGYVTALAKADADGALAYMATRPKSKDFMTDVVLSRSVALNPITGIEVLGSSVDGDQGTVTVKYRLGSIRVIDTYDVERSGAGFWRITGTPDDGGGDGYIEVKLDSTAIDGTVTFNGVAVRGASDRWFQMLPGTYQVGSTSSMLTSADVLVLPGLSGAHYREYSVIDEDSTSISYSPTLTLTPEADKKIADAVAATVNDCVSQTTEVTSCGLATSAYLLGKGDAKVASVARSLTPGSVDLAATAPALMDSVYATSCGAGKTDGMWAYWQSTDFSRVVVHNLVTLDTGKVVADHTALTSYAVDLSDPDHIVVHLIWPSDASCRAEGT